MSSIKLVELSSSPTGENKSWILVYLVGSLGDTIVCIPALEAIRRQFPDEKIILLHDYQTLVPVSPLDIIPKNLVDGSLSYVMRRGLLPKLAEFYRLRKIIKQQKVKAVIYLVASERFGWLVWRDKLFFQLCGIENLIGFYPFSKKEQYERDSFDKPILKSSEAVLKLQRLERDGIDIQNLNFTNQLLQFSEAEKRHVKDWLNARRQNTNARLVAMCPGCKRAANDWGIENFIEIGKRLLADGKSEIIIVGGKAEKPLAAKMIEAWGSGIDATGEFAANESGALFAHCEFMFGNDTGTTHLAAAAGIPCVAVYHFRDNPGHWFPLGRGHLLIQHDVECAGCHLTTCPKPLHPCMTGIEVDDVWRLLTEFMAEQRTEAAPAYKRVLI
ncbi:MAG: glycosyltransferase family 9 protein [Pyrinomonadaceae bacterium]